MKTNKVLQKILIVAVAILMLATMTGLILSATAEGTTPSLTVHGKTLTLENNINIRYYIKVSGANPSDMEMLYWTAPSQSYEKGDEDSFSKTVGIDPKGSGAYAFDYTETSAKQMPEYIYARAYVEVDGKGYYGEVIKYSVLQYAYNNLNKPAAKEELQTLLRDMLDYGASAQIYFKNYNADRLANADFHQVTVVGGTLSDGFNTGLYLAGESVVLIAPETDADGMPFVSWQSADGTVVSNDASATVTMESANETYTAVYQTAPEATADEYFTFTLLDNDTYSIAAKDVANMPKSIVLPSEYDEKSVTAIDSYGFHDCEALINVTIPDSIKTLGSGAFEGCSSLTDINIPSNVTSIGYEAFYGCSNLKNVSISELSAWCQIHFANSFLDGHFSNPLYYADHLYLNGVLVADLVLPDGITSIGNSAFYGYEGLTSVTIPNSITSIEDYTFSNCTNLKTVELPSSITSIGNDAFYCCTSLEGISLSDGIVSIGSGAFTYCTKITEIENGVSYVGKWAIDCEESITEMTLRSDTRGIADLAFDASTSLASVVVPDSVVYIGIGAFGACTALERIDIGNSVSSIGAYTFLGCTTLEGIVLPDSTTSIGDMALYGCASLESIHIGSGLESIGTGALATASDLTTIAIASKNQTYHAFGNCLIETASKTLIVGYPSSIIPSDGSVERIESGAFYGFQNLASIVLPDSITSIGDSAFEDCTSLSTIYYMGSANDFASITIGTTGNDPLASATVYYYSETAPTTNGNFWHDVGGVPTPWEIKLPSVSL